MKGILYGIGVGPGDPELMTIKAINTITACDIIAVPDSGSEKHVALDIAYRHIGDKPVLHLDLPMTHDVSELQKKRFEAAATICSQLDMGRKVGFLTLGDPMIYSTYSYLHTIIVSRGYTVTVIPGVTSFCAAAAALGEPLCEGGQTLHIVPATYTDSEKLLLQEGTKVFMKSGRKLCEMITHISKQNRRAFIAQRIGMDGEKLYRDVRELRELRDPNKETDTDYFSIIIAKEGNAK